MKKIIIFSNVLLLLFLVILHLVLIVDSKAKTQEQYFDKMKSVVMIPYSLADSFEKTFRDNPHMNLKKIQEEFINLCNQFRFDNNDFFFILDGKGNIVSHPLRPSLLWWNLLSETDKSGRYFFKELINSAKRDGYGYIETQWQSKYNDQINEKQIIYGLYFWPWDWIICTPFYINETDFEGNPMSTSLLIIYFGFTIIFNLFIILFLRRFRKELRGSDIEQKL